MNTYCFRVILADHTIATEEIANKLLRGWAG